ncbi:zwei Ig domain protein zig-8-like [Phlebotomus papatasi]|uniref:zwei Ig domain protein zig-8-like n=1 Tax=Phlebotomus papatasi TaxID=29031 RepID=UPI002483BB81|nr:zwei Ig domain protein zig-8-like [Phlebotomus papatasi]
MEIAKNWTSTYFSLGFLLLCIQSGKAAAISTNGIQIKDTHIQNIDLENEYELVEMDHQAHQESPKLIGTPVINRGPYFDTSASKNVTALVGKTAYLNCRVHNLGNRTVSWIRHRDLHLLTVGRFTYTSDLRFQSVHNPQTEDWSLQVRYPQKRDSGIYECQVSTTPPIAHCMQLSIVEPITSILGGPELFINTGSTINLTCIIRHSPEPPPGIYWTHDNLEISYDSPRGGVSVITEKGEITTSYLLIQRAKDPDSGKYTCSPSNANPVSVTVHVLNGEHPAAMQHGDQLKISDPIYVFVLVFFTIMCGR